MYSRWANFTVIVLWLATMTWLVKARMLPSLLVGEPPDRQNILAARQKEPLVGWHLCWNNQAVGWALSLTRPLPRGFTEIRSRVHFARLPIGEMTPGWLRALLDTLEAPPAWIKADARTTLSVDADGQLSRVQSTVHFGSLGEAVCMTGEVKGTKMAISVQSRELSDQREIPINIKALRGETFSPQTQLPGLHKGQTWTVEVCSPLGYASSPVEVLQAKVVELDRFFWRGDMLPAWRVEYHSKPGFQLSTAREPRGCLWVRPDGTVLAQEVSILNSKMRFVRMGETEAAALADKHKLTGTQ